MLRRWSFILKLGVGLLLLLIVVFPGLVAPHDPNEMHIEAILEGPSWRFPLGTDEFGRDLLSRCLYGARISLAISGVAVLIAMIIGIPLGLVSGYFGGPVDSIIMRLQDALLSFPMVLLAILLVATLGSSMQTVTVAIAVAYIPRFARLARAGTLVIKEQEYIEAARAIGAGHLRTLFRGILPNAMGPLIVQATLAVAVSILIETGLSYLGLGVQPPTPSWGNLLRSAQTYIRIAPWYVLSPGAFVFATVLGFNLLGDRLRERLDPRVRRALD